MKVTRDDIISAYPRAIEDHISAAAFGAAMLSVKKHLPRGKNSRDDVKAWLALSPHIDATRALEMMDLAETILRRVRISWHRVDPTYFFPSPRDGWMPIPPRMYRERVQAAQIRVFRILEGRESDYQIIDGKVVKINPLPHGGRRAGAGRKRRTQQTIQKVAVGMKAGAVIATLSCGAMCDPADADADAEGEVANG